MVGIAQRVEFILAPVFFEFVRQRIRLREGHHTILRAVCQKYGRQIIRILYIIQRACSHRCLGRLPYRLAAYEQTLGTLRIALRGGRRVILHVQHVRRWKVCYNAVRLGQSVVTDVQPREQRRMRSRRTAPDEDVPFVDTIFVGMLPHIPNGRDGIVTLRGEGRNIRRTVLDNRNDISALGHGRDLRHVCVEILLHPRRAAHIHDARETPLRIVVWLRHDDLQLQVVAILRGIYHILQIGQLPKLVLLIQHLHPIVRRYGLGEIPAVVPRAVLGCGRNRHTA